MPHSAEDIALACLPWAAFYGIVFVASRVLGPALFAHCRNLDAPGRSYWAESVVSTVNSLVLTPMAWHASEETDLLNLATSFSAATPLTTLCCVAMCGYTAWDTLLGDTRLQLGETRVSGLLPSCKGTFHSKTRGATGSNNQRASDRSNCAARPSFNSCKRGW